MILVRPYNSKDFLLIYEIEAIRLIKSDITDHFFKRNKPNFPKKVSLGANSVGYFESDVNRYLNNIKNLNEVIYA